MAKAPSPLSRARRVVPSLGEFSVDRFDARAVQVIGEHVRATPLFLYYAIPLVHAPMQAPASVLEEHKHTLARFGNHERKLFAAQTIMLDKSVAAVVGALDAAGLANDTLMVIARSARDDRLIGRHRGV